VRRGASRGERGFALLIVLWSVALLALIFTQITGTGRQEMRLAGNLRAGDTAQAMADGAVYEAVFRLLAGQWQIGALPSTLRRADGVVRVAVVPEDGKVNPNIVNPALMSALLIDLGAAPAQASAVTAEMQEWRAGWIHRESEYSAAGLPYVPTGQPFRSVDEVGMVLDMTPGLFAALRPHLSVYRTGEVRSWEADPVVGRALVEAGLPDAPNNPREAGNAGRVVTVTIIAEAAVQGGGRFVRRATVELRGGANGAPFTILAWDSGV
jgi:general secretion pathway protein K